MLVAATTTAPAPGGKGWDGTERRNDTKPVANAPAKDESIRIDAVKLDVEGAEDLILDPFFRDAPASLHPSLLIIPDVPERWQVDVSKLLEDKGYRQTLRTRMNLVFERPNSSFIGA